MGGFHRLVDKVKQLPPGARLFGKGFLSSPQLAFYADRDLDDIDRYTAGDLASIGVGYIIADASAVNARRFAPELRRYPHEVIAMNLGYEIYRLDFKARKNPFGKREMNSPQVPSSVDFTARNYPFVFGLHGPSRTGWRWARTDAEILLHYRNERAVELKVHKPGQRYAKPDVPLVLTVSVDGCALGSQAVAPKEEHVLRFKIPTECHLVAGRNVRLQVLSNNMLATVPADLRQLSYVILAAGFVQ
jgi:hypothetical protein